MKQNSGGPGHPLPTPLDAYGTWTPILKSLASPLIAWRAPAASGDLPSEMRGECSRIRFDRRVPQKVIEYVG
jgi:hypothetical protein